MKVDNQVCRSVIRVSNVALYGVTGMILSEVALTSTVFFVSFLVQNKVDLSSFYELVETYKLPIEFVGIATGAIVGYEQDAEVEECDMPLALVGAIIGIVNCGPLCSFAGAATGSAIDMVVG